MKRLVTTKHYQGLEKDFKIWLATLGYATSTVNRLPIYLRELFYYLEKTGKTEIEQATGKDIKYFFFQWKKRKNQRSGTGGLSNGHINNGILAINKLIQYLQLTDRVNIEINLQREATKYKPIVVLTQSEIGQLYKTIDSYPEKRKLTTPYRLRDRAILAIFYSCGLRSSEGSHLDITDVLIDKRLLLIKKGKGSKERYVPITENNLQDILSYITEGRSWFLEPGEKKKQPQTKALLISERGQRLNSIGIYMRIKYLQAESNLDKTIGVHTLRHSIATHLLQQGMSLEMISKFLGHSTLESTQIYTHLINEL